MFQMSDLDIEYIFKIQRSFDYFLLIIDSLSDFYINS